MPEARGWEPTTIQLGPTLVDVPADWEVQDSGQRGLVVLTMPLGHDPALQKLRHVPGFIQPNLVVRFFPMAADQGGVARAAGDELRAGLHSSPGASLLAVTPFATRAGFPGRAQLIVGIYQRVPYQMSRWYIGVGDTVVEIVLTLPSSFQPELLQLGENVARTVRPDPSGAEADATHGSSLPAIPPSRLDHTVSEESYADDDGDSSAVVHAELEKVEWFVEDIDLNRLPGRPGTLSRAAAEHLQNTVELGSVQRFSAHPKSEGGELEALGVVSNGALTDRGRHLTSGMREEPDVVLTGRRAGQSTEAMIWLDGEEATLLLGPTARDLEMDPEVSGRTHYILRELSLSVPVILDSWSGNEAAWFTDTTVVCSPSEVEGILAGEAVPQRLRAESSSLALEALTEGMSLWTANNRQSGQQVQWLRSRRRGPFLVSRGETAESLQLSSTTGSFIHDSLRILCLGRPERQGTAARSGDSWGVRPRGPRRGS